MSRILIEATMPEGPKFDGIPSAAGWLHICGLTYAAQALTDGFIPAGRIHKLTNDPPRVVAQAVKWLTTPRPGQANALWEEVDGGWLIHDFADPQYNNPTRATHSKLVLAKVEAGRIGGQRSVDARRMRFGTAQPQPNSRPPNTNPEAEPEAPATKHSEAAGEAASKLHYPSNTNTNTSTFGTEAEPEAADVVLLCQRMVELNRERSVRARMVTEDWRFAARSLLDTGTSLEEALAVLEWAVRDSFWGPVILGLPKFREKYDELRLKREQMLRGRTTGGNREHPTDVRVKQLQARAAAATTSGLEVIGE